MSQNSQFWLGLIGAALYCLPMLSQMLDVKSMIDFIGLTLGSAVVLVACGLLVMIIHGVASWFVAVSMGFLLAIVMTKVVTAVAGLPVLKQLHMTSPHHLRLGH